MVAASGVSVVCSGAFASGRYRAGSLRRKPDRLTPGSADIPDSVDMEPVVAQPQGLAQPPDLSILLSQVLLAFTIEFERDSKVSLTISANVLRVLSDEWMPMREIPKLTGVSKEAVSMSVGYLERTGHAVVGDDPSRSRGKAVRLTEKGTETQARYRRLVLAIEDRWAERFGEAAIGALRESLEELVGDHDRLLVWPGAVPRGWARRFPPARDPPAPSDGPSSRRIPRRQLTGLLQRHSGFDRSDR
jgi:DNA-binding MarR family transcriptional regulator